MAVSFPTETTGASISKSKNSTDLSILSYSTLLDISPLINCWNSGDRPCLDMSYKKLK